MRTPRFDRLDALRGVAIVWMAGFHFAFDLAHFGVIHQDFHRDPVWLLQRTCIVSMFLFCAGLGQSVACDSGLGWTRFWKRWIQVAGCALLVSLGSWFMFPQSYISFGVLHGIAVMLIVTRLSSRWGAWLWPLGAIAIGLPHVVQSTFFDSRLTDWVGLVTHLPVTEDYVPVLPWLGVMWWGLASGRWLARHRPTLMSGALPHVLAPFAALGRWSLAFYMVHQPLLIGLLTAWVALRG